MGSNKYEESSNYKETEAQWLARLKKNHKPKRRILNPGGGAMPVKIRRGRGWHEHPKKHAEAARKGVLRRRGY